MRTSLYGAAAALSLLLAAGCGGSSDKPAQSAPTGSSQPTTAVMPVLGAELSVIATAHGPTVEVFTKPGDPSPSLRLANPGPNQVPRVFLVLERRPGWFLVLLPTLPNGSKGWIAADTVTTTKTSYWLQVRRSQFQLRLYQGKKLLINARAAIGTTDTPTPGGRYYLTELLQAPNPNGDYGPYAYGLSGYSETLQQFDGHDPIIGIHGTNQPGLLGTAVSHGCIRVDNSTITRLAGMLPLGTPVQITA
jgi:lipoprotein-anchoring transpeptidase ErfK/SrfK